VPSPMPKCRFEMKCSFFFPRTFLSLFLFRSSVPPPVVIGPQGDFLLEARVRAFFLVLRDSSGFVCWLLPPVSFPSERFLSFKVSV